LKSATQRPLHACSNAGYIINFKSLSFTVYFTYFADNHLNYDYMIKLQVIGNLGKDCVVNNVNGKNVINFSVAHTEKFKDAQGQQKDKTIWVECAYWTDRTAISPYLKKGTQVYAEGTPDLRNYTTKDGTPGTSLSLRVSSVQLLGSRGDSQGENTGGGFQQQPYNQSQPVTNGTANEITEPMDDLPF
jgi:single-strand DNA-binding protein